VTGIHPSIAVVRAAQGNPVSSGQHRRPGRDYSWHGFHFEALGDFLIPRSRLKSKFNRSLALAP
jgi:hypothetical protein